MTLQNATNIPITTSDSPAKGAGKYVSDLLATHIDQPLLLLIAGGSSLSILDYINPEYLGNNITVTVTDERFTDDVEHNNFAMLQTTPFYDDLIQVDAFCINTQLFSEDTLDIHRARFEKNIRDWQKEFPKGIIIGVFGMGSDGHIAGIIPGIYNQEEFNNKFDGEQYVADVNALGKNEHPLRITTTFSFMRLVNFSVFFITGESKRSALEMALAKDGSLFETPARIMQEMKRPEIFTDISFT